MTRLEDQLAEERKQKQKQQPPPKSADEKKADEIFAERKDEAAKCDLTEAQQLENVQNQIKRLRAEQELKSVQDGYQSYQDAVIQLSNGRKQLEEDRAKLPNLLEREKIVQDKESDIEQRVDMAEKYFEEKHLDADNYFVARKREGDSHYKVAMDNFTREYTEKNGVLKQMAEELQVKIDFYNENIEPLGLLLAKDSSLIYLYLTNYIYPILNNGTLKLFGTFNKNIVGLREYATKAHDGLYNDAIKLLTMAEKIKE